MIPAYITERRRTARIPTGARLPHRAVGMHDYELCDVVNVTTSGLELLLSRPLNIGTFVTILMQPEGSSKKYYRVVGRVERCQPRGAKWLHVMRASSHRPWSPMFIYDVMYQTLDSSKSRFESGHEKHNGTYNLPAGHDGKEQATARADQVERESRIHVWNNEGVGADIADITVYRALSEFVPFNELNDMIRRAIAHDHEITTRPAGTDLIKRGAEDDVAIYLVAGVLQLEGFDERKFYVVADTNCARYPISLLRPHAYQIKAATEVAVILFSQDLIKKIIHIIASFRNNRNMGIEVSELR